MRMSDFPSLNQESEPPTHEWVDRPEKAKSRKSPDHNQETIHPEVIDHLMAIGPHSAETADS